MTSSGSEQKGSYPGKRAGGDTSRTNQADQGARKQETSLMSLVDYQKQGKHTIQGLFRAVADADAQLGALFKTDALSTEYLSQTAFVAHGRVAIKYVETANAYDGYCLSLTQATCPSGNGCAPSYLSSNAFLCNGMHECLDGSDEDPTFCATFNCSADGRVGRALKEDENEEASAPVGVV